MQPPMSPQSSGTYSGMRGNGGGLAGGAAASKEGFQRSWILAALLARSGPARAGSTSKHWGTRCACSYTRSMTFATCSGHPITGASRMQ